MKYKCPDCGRINLGMYCDTCDKSLSSKYAVSNTSTDAAISTFTAHASSGGETRRFFVSFGDIQTLEVYDTYLILSFVNNAAITNRSQSRKRINYVDITAVQLKKPTKILGGFVQFAYMGSTENTNRQASFFDVLNDENTFQFAENQFPLIQQVVDFIDRRRGELKAAPNIVAASQTSTADEIKKFKDLLDSGIITQSEFDAKKKQLLNL